VSPRREIDPLPVLLERRRPKLTLSLAAGGRPAYVIVTIGDFKTEVSDKVEIGDSVVIFPHINHPMREEVSMERSGSTTAANHQSGFADTFVKNEAYSSGVSWAAVIAGAFVAAALSLILLALGTGLGLSSVSPWSNVGASATTIHKAAIVWLIIIQIIASAMGGYLAGRLRTKWATIHTDEVYFRDTAHGFLVWAVGLVITASFLASAATSMVGGAGQVRATSFSNAGGAEMVTDLPADGQNLDPNEYFIDTLFRSDHRSPDRNNAPVRAEAARIFAHALRQGNLPAADETYLAELVAARTELSQTDAEKRVSDVFVEIQRTADTARRAVSHLSLWIFIALLIGAFCASYAATIGGRQRDQVKLV
jgi:hypothetical protein